MKRYEAVDNRRKLNYILIMEDFHDNVELKDMQVMFRERMIKIREMDDTGRYHCRSWSITREQANLLIQDINKDKDKEIKYQVFGNNNIYNKSRSAGDFHNCFTWAREKIHNIRDERITLPEQWTSLPLKLVFI